MTPVPASVSQLRYTPRDRLWPMGSARPDLPNVRGTQEPRHTSSSRRLGPERRIRTALLASPKVGIRRRALLTKPSSWPASGRSLTTARNRSPISLAVTPDPGSNAWNPVKAEQGAIRDSRMAIDYLASGVSSRRYARIAFSTAVRARPRAAARACSYSCRVGFEICNFNAASLCDRFSRARHARSRNGKD